MAGPRGRDRHATPPSAVRGRRQGTRAPPPPPLPSLSGPRADGGRPKKRRPRQPPRRGRCTRGAGAPRPGQAPARPARCRPTADRRRLGRRKRSGPFRGRPGEDRGANQSGGVPPPPPPPPPAALTRWRPTGPRPTPAAALQPPRHEYSRGGTPETMDGRPTPHGVGGQGGGPPTPPPPAPPPPSLGATGATLCPPWSRGGAPPPPEGTAAWGGGCGWTCKPRAPAPPAACSRGGRGRQASPHQRAGATRGPSLGAAHGGVPEQYGGRAPHDPPMTTAHSGRAERGFRSAGAPGGAVHGPPLIPPHPWGGPETPTARARRRGVRRRHDGGQDGVPRAATKRVNREAAARPPTPHPPHRPASRGGPGPAPPEAGGMVPPPPARERSRARPAPPPQPPAPTGTAENKRARVNAPGRRTDRAQ